MRPQQTVHPALDFFRHSRMAAGTVDRRKLRLVRDSFRVHVARLAIQPAMHAALQRPLIDVQRSSGVAPQLLLAVAGKAFLRSGRLSRRKDDDQPEQENQPHQIVNAALIHMSTGGVRRGRRSFVISTYQAVPVNQFA
jgi:hypothetical protein